MSNSLGTCGSSSLEYTDRRIYDATSLPPRRRAELRGNEMAAVSALKLGMKELIRLWKVLESVSLECRPPVAAPRL